MTKKLFFRRISIGVATLLVMAQANLVSSLNNRFITNVKAKDGELYAWNNTIPQKKPIPQKSNGKLVLFDNSHGETVGQADWVLDGGFSDFADDLVANGYTVREYRGIDKNGDGNIRYYDDRKSENVDKNEAVITYDAIKDADVFVMAEANRPFTRKEQDALKKFIDSGKGIYFIADHYNADRNTNTWDGTEVYNGYNRSTSSYYNMGGEYGDLRNPQDASKGWLAENFGLRFRFNAIDLKSGFTGIKAASETEGLTQGVKPILMAAGSTLAIVDGNKAKGLVYLGTTDRPVKWNNAADKGLYFGGEKEGAFVAISKPSKGKAAFIGDSSPIEDITAKYKNESNGSYKDNHDGYKSTGNAAKLSVNLVNWLACEEDYVGFDGVNRTKGINTQDPMADIEKNETKAEPWATPKYDPWNTDTFAPGSYNAPQPASDSGEVINVEEITLDKATLKMNPDVTDSIVATVLPSDATNKDIIWKSSDETVATVSYGYITAKKVGRTIITAITVDGAKEAKCNVEVTNSIIPKTKTVTLIKEGFDTVLANKSGITSGIPKDWTFSKGLNVYTTTGNYGESSPSIKFQGTENQIVTPDFKLTDNGKLSFWIKGNQPEVGCDLLLESFDGVNWNKIGDIKQFPTEGKIVNYDIDKNTIKIRFTYTKTTGNVAIDDVLVTKEVADEPVVVPWTQIEPAPVVPWTQLEPAPVVPWTQIEPAPVVPWTQVEPAPVVPWTQLEPAPVVPWTQLEPAPVVSWTQVEPAPVVPWTQVEPAPVVSWTPMTPALTELTPATKVPSDLVPSTPVPSTLTPATKVVPKTGSPIDMKVCIAVGSLLSIVGLILLLMEIRKRK